MCISLTSGADERSKMASGKNFKDSREFLVLFGDYLAIGLMLRPGGGSLQIRALGRGFGNGSKTH